MAGSWGHRWADESAADRGPVRIAPPQWKELAVNFAKCRVLIVPSANPDRRARCQFDSWVGER
jgi:hypothetical protein